MKSTFPTVALGELCDVQIGKTPTRATERFWAPDHPWLSIADMNQGRQLRSTKEGVSDAAVRELNLRRVEPGTVLLSFKLSIGKVGVAARPMFTNEAIAHLPIIGDAVLPEYLYWALRFVPLTGDADRAAMGATLNKAKVKRLAIPVPSLDEQRRIVAVLDAADALRAARVRALVGLGRLTEALAEYEFKRGGRVDELGRHLTFLTSGARGWARFYSDSGQRFVRSLDVQMNAIGADDIVYVKAPMSAEARRIRIQNGDVLLTITGSRIGRAALAPPELEGAYISQHVSIIRMDPEVLVPEYLALWLSMPNHGQRQIARLQYGQTKPGLNFEQIRSFQLPTPAVRAQHDLLEQVTRVNVIRRTGERDLIRFEDLFTSLKQRAFRGEL